MASEGQLWRVEGPRKMLENLVIRGQLVACMPARDATELRNRGSSVPWTLRAARSPPASRGRPRSIDRFDVGSAPTQGTARELIGRFFPDFPIFRTFLGELNLRKLPSRRLRTHVWTEFAKRRLQGGAAQQIPTSVST